MARPRHAGGRRDRRSAVRRPAQRRLLALPDPAVAAPPTAKGPRHDPALQLRRISRCARAFPAHRRAGRRHRRAAGSAGRHRGSGRGQNRDDGRAGGVAGRQRLRRSRPGAGIDVHPQGRRAAAAPGPIPAGPVGRRRVWAPASPGALESADTPTVSTYHAFAGSLLRDYGLLLPVEPDTRLLSETELWQLAFDVVNRHGGQLRTDKTPAAVTSMVLRLWGQLDRAPGRHRPAPRYPPGAGAAGPHPAGGPLPARPRPEPMVAAAAGRPDRAHRTGAAARRAATSGCAPTR